MAQIHLVIRRISPALKIDLVQIGRIKDGQFSPVPFDAVADSPVASYLKSSHVSDSLYVDHSEISGLIGVCCALHGFCFEFFDNTVVLMFDLELDLDCYESASKEEGKGN